MMTSKQRVLIAVCSVIVGTLTGCSQVPIKNQNLKSLSVNSGKEPAAINSISAQAPATTIETIEGCNGEKPCAAVSPLDTGRTLMNLGRLGTAEREFAKVIANNPSDLDAAFYQTLCLMMLGRSDEFFDMDAKTAQMRKGSVKGTLMSSWFARARGNMKLASQLANDALKKEPQSSLCLFTAGLANENPKAGIVDLDRALKLQPDEFVYIVTRSNLSRAAGDKKGAEEWLDKASKRAPKNELIMLTRGDRAQQDKHDSEAIEFFRKAALAEPNLYAVYMRLHDYYKRTNKVAEEAEFYTELLKKYPDHPKVLLERGRSYYEQGKFKKAYPDFERLIEITEGSYENRFLNALGHMFRANRYTRELNWQKAFDEYRLAHKYYPDNIDIQLSAIIMAIETPKHAEAEKMIEAMMQHYLGSGTGTASDGATQTAGGEMDKHHRAVLLALKAKLRAAQSRWDEVYAPANEAIKLDPSTTAAYEARARAYYNQKKYAQALVDYKKISTPEFDQRGNISSCYFTTGKTKQAIEVISAYIKDHPDQPLGYVGRANFYMANGQRAKAEADVQAALQAPLQTAGSHWSLSNTLLAMGKSEESANQLAEALRNDTDANSIKSKLGLMVKNMAGPNQLIITFSKKSDEEPNNPQFLYILGTLQMMAGRADRAETHLNKAVSLNPNVGAYFVERGIMYSKTDRLDDALKDLNKGLDEFGVQDSDGYCARGRVLMNLAQWAKAEKDLTKAITLMPSEKAPYAERGMVYSRLRQDKKAIADFEKALSQKDLDPRKTLLRLAPLYEENGQLEKALGLYNRLLDLGANDIQAMERRADLYMKLNRPKEAIADYNQLLKLSNAFTGILYKRGKAYEKLGKFDLAERDFADAKSTDKEMLGPERKRKKPSLTVHY